MSELMPWTPELAPGYPKIYSPFKRATEGSNKNRLIDGEWYDHAFDTLQNAQWRWTEKLDGTNIRIHWDGFRRHVGGRTDRAELPGELVSWIDENLPEELFEQMFQEKPVTLYGEGVGPGIQKVGSLYGDHKKFVLFDARIGGVWVSGTTVREIATGLGVEQAKLISTSSVHHGIAIVEKGLKSAYGDFYAEGLVGVPVDGFLNYRGGRIMLKVKHCDFFEKKVIRNGE